MGAGVYVIMLLSGVAAILIVIVAYRRRRPFERSYLEVAQIIENFATGAGDVWDWDDFITIPIRQSDLNEIRIKCIDIHEEYPPRANGEYCSEEGVAEMFRIVDELRSAASQSRVFNRD